MIKFFTKQLRNKKGFTLVELIVVIAILGILAAIAVPRLTSFTEKAENTAKDATLRTVRSAWSIYRAEGSSAQNWPDDYLEGATWDNSSKKLTISSNSGETQFVLTLSDNDTWGFEQE